MKFGKAFRRTGIFLGLFAFLYAIPWIGNWYFLGQIDIRPMAPTVRLTADQRNAAWTHFKGRGEPKLERTTPWFVVLSPLKDRADWPQGWNHASKIAMAHLLHEQNDLEAQSNWRFREAALSIWITQNRTLDEVLEAVDREFGHEIANDT